MCHYDCVTVPLFTSNKANIYKHILVKKKTKHSSICGFAALYCIRHLDVSLSVRGNIQRSVLALVSTETSLNQVQIYE